MHVAVLPHKLIFARFKAVKKEFLMKNDHLYITVLTSHREKRQSESSIVELFLTTEQKEEIINSEGETPLFREVEKALSERPDLPGPVGRKVSVVTMGLGDYSLNEKLGEIFRKMPLEEQHRFRLPLVSVVNQKFALVEQTA